MDKLGYVHNATNVKVGESGITKVDVEGYQLKCYRDEELAYEVTLPIHMMTNINLYEDSVGLVNANNGIVVLLYDDMGEVFTTIKDKRLIGLIVIESALVQVIQKHNHVIMTAINTVTKKHIDTVNIHRCICEDVYYNSMNTIVASGYGNIWGVAVAFEHDKFIGLLNAVKLASR